MVVANRDILVAAAKAPPDSGFILLEAVSAGLQR